MGRQAPNPCLDADGPKLFALGRTGTPSETSFVTMLATTITPSIHRPHAAAAARPRPAGPDDRPSRRLECADPDDEDEDLGDEEDLSVAEPLADEESNFDDFDDEFDDDFEEEENDPDWDHPEDDAPPAQDQGRRK